jgi:hypothetical protein
MILSGTLFPPSAQQRKIDAMVVAEVSRKS